jgi:Flp pilus assembly protein TadG
MSPTGKTFRRRRPSAVRHGTSIIEGAFILPVALTLMLGVWEVGRMVEVCQILDNAAREGARMAAGGYVNGTPVTCAMVQTEVSNYLTAAGFPSTAANGAVTTVNCLASTSWTDPYQAQPSDPFTVTATIPSGAPFNALRWNLLNRITSISQLSETVYWESTNNSQVTVSTTLPY